MSQAGKKAELIIQAGKEHSQLVIDPNKGRTLCWIQHPFIYSHINCQISGDPEIDWLSWFKKKYSPVPFQYGLSLGCGTGHVEREAIEKEICREFDGIDITPDSI